MNGNSILPKKSKQPSSLGLSTPGVKIMRSMDAISGNSFGSSMNPVPAHEKPGYKLWHYVDDFIETETGPIPRVKTRLDRKDKISTVLVRCGINRYRYKVVPGVYAVGSPDKNSEVLVTANFKLTFDLLRQELKGLNLWILVLDTRGINVWCAAGEGNFATRELTERIKKVNLDRIVDHKRIIVPQLGATGVAARAVKKESGFRVVYGPVRARDIPRFLTNKRKADKTMRTVTFTFFERLILTPVEIQIFLKPALITALILFLVSGIGPGLFSFSGAWSRGFAAFVALLTGMVSGAIITPALLPFIPVREFALKGIIAGSIGAMIMMGLVPSATSSFSTGFALFLFSVSISSFLAMNFTGTTPFTSPTGVEKEMKRYIPVQLISLVLSTGFWIYSAF